MAKVTNGERIAVLETKVDILISRSDKEEEHRQNGRLLKYREIGIWIGLGTMLLKVFEVF